MGVEDGGPTEVHLEPAEEDDSWEECPCCGSELWLRAIAAYRRGVCWVIFCADCGKSVQEKWSILP